MPELVVVLWRAGLRIHEPLALGEADLDHRRSSILIRAAPRQRRAAARSRHGPVGWEQLQPWIEPRLAEAMAAASSSLSRKSQAASVEDVAELRLPLYERGPAKGGEDFRRPFRETKVTPDAGRTGHEGGAAPPA